MFKARSSGREGITCGDGAGVDGLTVVVAAAAMVDMVDGRKSSLGTEEYINCQLVGPLVRPTREFKKL